MFAFSWVALYLLKSILNLAFFLADGPQAMQQRDPKAR